MPPTTWLADAAPPHSVPCRAGFRSQSVCLYPHPDGSARSCQSQPRTPQAASPQLEQSRRDLLCSPRQPVRSSGPRRPSPGLSTKPARPGFGKAASATTTTLASSIASTYSYLSCRVLGQFRLSSRLGMLGRRLPAADEAVRFITATLTPAGLRCKGVCRRGFQRAGSERLVLRFGTSSAGWAVRAQTVTLRSVPPEVWATFERQPNMARTRAGRAAQVSGSPHWPCRRPLATALIRTCFCAPPLLGAARVETAS